MPTSGGVGLRACNGFAIQLFLVYMLVMLYRTVTAGKSEYLGSCIILQYPGISNGIDDVNRTNIKTVEMVA